MRGVPQTCQTGQSRNQVAAFRSLSPGSLDCKYRHYSKQGMVERAVPHQDVLGRSSHANRALRDPGRLHLPRAALAAATGIKRRPTLSSGALLIVFPNRSAKNANG